MCSQSMTLFATENAIGMVVAYSMITKQQLDSSYRSTNPDVRDTSMATTKLQHQARKCTNSWSALLVCVTVNAIANLTFLARNKEHVPTQYHIAVT